jgi:hypothetical protein
MAIIQAVFQIDENERNSLPAGSEDPLRKIHDSGLSNTSDTPLKEPAF